MQKARQASSNALRLPDYAISPAKGGGDFAECSYFTANILGPCHQVEHVAASLSLPALCFHDVVEVVYTLLLLNKVTKVARLAYNSNSWEHTYLCRNRGR